MKALARRFFKSPANGASSMSSKEVFARLKSNSREWHQASNNELKAAVRKINSEIGRRRVTFVKIEFPAKFVSAVSVRY
ncbi:MAG TPA: hypothetical protein VM656_09235 [Pyrinomonadaceae bacterium]|nr:hypothetical protein [Pyrinomonadaceae bacterium]